ncbi:MAG TPA: DUF2975 domain-containing protein [Vicinamibacterales bacterium]|nr:DUF2975 domain-containing protein [Vicinamibacterales bacterium]
MRAMGKGSVSSFLTGLLTLGWYTVSGALVLTTLLVVLSPFIDIPGWTMNVSAVPPSADVTIPAASPGRGVSISAVPPGVDIDHTPSVVDAPGLMMSIPVSFSVDRSAHRVTAPSLSVESAQIQNGQGSLRFPVRRDAFFLGNAIVLIVLLAVVLLVIGQLRAVFRTLQAGQPFVPANATRIRWIAYAVIVSEIARSAIVFFENYYAMTHFAAEGLRFHARPEVNGLVIVSGLIILVLAEVFRVGTRLDEDQSLTV